MTREKGPKKGPAEDRRGLTNGNGIPRPAGLTNGLGRTNGLKGRTNGLTNGLRGRTNGLTNGLGRTNGMTNGLQAGGRTNGLTNGMKGRTNGMTNGVRGRTNGLTNGTGRTNGTGVINGLINGTIRRGLRHNRYGVITQKDLRLGISIVVLFLLLLGPFYLLLSSPPPASPTRIAVDGALGDWSGIPFLNDTIASPNADVALRSYSAFLENQYLSFAIRVAGIPLGDPTGVDGFYIFIDKDDNAATGYRAREVGADYMIGIRGGNNAVSSSALFGFRTTAQTTDWAGWESLDSVRAAVSATALEAQLQPGEVDFGTRYAFLIGASDYDGNESLGSVHFNTVPGTARRALLVEQTPATDLVATSGQPLVALTFTAFGAAVDITHIGMTKVSGPGLLGALDNVAVPTGASPTRAITVNFNPADAGQYVVARADPAGITVAGNVPVTVEGPDVVAYLGSAPPGHVTDGFFRDWDPSQMGPPGATVEDANVDLERYAANRTGSTAFIYADVAGRIFGGSAVVEKIEPATGGGGGGQGSPGPAVSRVGEDIVRAYIDVDTAQPAGVMADGVRADYKIEIHGMYGRVLLSQAYRWTGSAWTAASQPGLAFDRTRMEASLDLTGVTTGTMAMAIEATDWRLLTDATGVYSFLEAPGGGTRGSNPPSLAEAVGGDRLDVTPLTAAPAVDGSCRDAEYVQAGGIRRSLGGLIVSVGRTAGFLYLCLVVTADTTLDAGDFAEVVFDRARDGASPPTADDRMFSLAMDSAAMQAFAGDGSSWQPCGPACGAADVGVGTFTSGNPHYEFRIAEADAWWSPDTGSSLRAHDARGGVDIVWGATGVGTLSADPGPVPLPEFHEILVPVAVVGVIYFVARRRRRNEDP